MRFIRTVRALCLAPILGLVACNTPVLENRQLRDLDVEHFNGWYMSYFLPKGEVVVTADYNPEKSELSLTIGTPVLKPDFSKHFHLVYNTSGLSSDTIEVKTTADGLLSSVSSKPVPEVVNIATEVNEVLAQVQSTAKAFNPKDKKNPTANIEADNKGKPPNCPGPLQTVVVLDVTNGGDHPQIKTQKADGCTLSVAITGSQVEPVNRLDSRIYPRPDEVLGLADCDRVVCYRALGGFRISASAKITGPGTGNQEVTAPAKEIVVPVRGQIGYIRFDRKLFGKNDITATFTNGALTELTTENSSEIVGFLKLPVELLKSVTFFVTAN